MQSEQGVESIITTYRNEEEISRLRFLLGGLRDEMFRLVWDGLEMDRAAYERETDRLLYGATNGN